tara:strand:+ start:66 stop:821 length:756 start_codon:yes stop_codon:yes gene_type:complete
MSGHSKWSTIKRKKAAVDAKRGMVFTRVSKDLTLAARQGGGDPDMNPALRLALQKAKSANMPKDNIDRAIKKGTGDLPGIKYEDFVYEGYGPGGVAIMLEVMTDNKNRTVPELRHMMSKNGGNLGEPGCVNWMFEKKGTISILREKTEEDTLLEKALELGANDFSSDEEHFIITTSPEQFSDVSRGLEDAGVQIDAGELILEPQNKVNVSGNDAGTLMKLLDLLEEHDDVQKIYSNFEIDDSELAKISESL